MCCTRQPCSLSDFAYILALLQIYFTYAGRAGGNPKLISYNDIVVGYSGNKSGSRLETALRGPMAGMVSSDERQVIFAWLADGSSRETYNKEIKSIIDANAWLATAAPIRIVRT